MKFIQIMFITRIMICFCDKSEEELYKDPDDDENNEKTDEFSLVRHRIVAGKKPFDLTNWNFIALIEKYEKGYFKHACDGALISPDCILTVGHCLLNSKKKVEAVEQLIIRLGVFNIKKEKGTYAKIAGYIFHPDFDNETYENDITIIKLLNPMKETSKIKYAKLADLESMPETETCKAAGWRMKRSKLQPVDANEEKIDWEDLFTFDSNEESNEEDDDDAPRKKRAVRNLVGRKITPNEELLEIELPVLPHEECIKHYKDFEDTDSIFCTSSSDGDMNSCTGDVGGPITCDPEYRLMGLTSQGVGCLQPNWPGVYVIVAKYKDWISQYCDISGKAKRKSIEESYAEESFQVTSKVKSTEKSGSDSIRRRNRTLKLLCVIFIISLRYLQ